MYDKQIAYLHSTGKTYDRNFMNDIKENLPNGVWKDVDCACQTCFGSLKGKNHKFGRHNAAKPKNAAIIPLFLARPDSDDFSDSSSDDNRDDDILLHVYTTYFNISYHIVKKHIV